MSNPIKPSLPRVTVEWLEIPDPDDDRHSWRIDYNFMMSPWSCMFGQGCTGHFGIQDAHTNPDVGCCTLGVEIESTSELERVQSSVDQLTEDDIAPHILKQIREEGWHDGNTQPVFEDDPERIQVATKTRDGGCIFANRSNDGIGKIGCAFHHLGERTGQSHVDLMPDICWTVPLTVSERLEEGYTEEDEEPYTLTVISASDAQNWGGQDEDGQQDSWMSWWCIDTPDAYQNDGKRLYRTMEEELRKIMGDGAYDTMVAEIEKRAGSYVPPTAGMVRNEGRPMLPLLVGNRTPRGGCGI